MRSAVALLADQSDTSALFFFEIVLLKKITPKITVNADLSNVMAFFLIKAKYYIKQYI